MVKALDEIVMSTEGYGEQKGDNDLNSQWKDYHIVAILEQCTTLLERIKDSNGETD